ncbi:Membrane-bound lytic murein transglycosylase B [Olavius algarvensis associated proteobacterium Delta 3]|nr:Membrane-bound lytic murein transglycosylase B [Olavius algarvensis associated proteobacterium Delta 3]CAB5166362.1 Membrane-bound lytic murein transglycosylase B [Olavius algarvensis associated proteobacterium Delta 3]
MRMWTIWLLVFVLVGPVFGSPTVGSSEVQFVVVQKWLIDDGFDSKWIQSLYTRPNVKFDTASARSYFRHREATLDYDQFTSDRSIEAARRYMDTHTQALHYTESVYGVDREIITAILLVETRLGTYTGKRSIFNTLSTLSALRDPSTRDAFWEEMPKTPRLNRDKYRKWAAGKSSWAYRELKAFLKYASKQGMDPTEIYGSYAGALGIAQFIPSSIVVYARDGNEDGKVNLFHHEDAIASVGSYLKRNGWRPGIDRKKASKVIYRYNHSEYYVNTILKISDILTQM